MDLFKVLLRNRNIYINLLVWFAILGCNQFNSPQIIELDINRLEKNPNLKDLFYVEKVIPIDLPYLADNPYKVKIVMFPETFYWYGETHEGTYLFLYKIDGSLISRIQEFSTILDIRTNYDNLEILGIDYIQMLNPYGGLIHSKKYKNAGLNEFWITHFGYFTKEQNNNDTIFELINSNTIIPRYLIKWKNVDTQIDFHEGDKYRGNILISDNLVISLGGINGIKVNFIYNGKLDSVLLFSAPIGKNMIPINLPVVGLEDNDLILFVNREQLKMFIEPTNDHEYDNYIIILRLSIDLIS